MTTETQNAIERDCQRRVRGAYKLALVFALVFGLLMYQYGRSDRLSHDDGCYYSQR